jgi:putative aldouronate transport system substrate-binding protein
MKKKVLRSLCYVIAGIMMAITLMTGCSSSNEVTTSENNSTISSSSKLSTNTSIAKPGNSSNELEWKSDISPFTFRQYFYGTWATDYIWKDQFSDKYITEKTGVTIDRFLATGSDNDYLSTIIAANDLPDSIMLDWNNPLVTKLINGGMVYSIDKLIDKYCPKFKGSLDKEMVQYHTLNGKLWYLPNFYNTKESVLNNRPGISIRPWFVRQDIYNALGKPQMDTPDKLISVLKQVKQKYLDIGLVGMEPFDVNSNGFKGSRSMDFLIYSFAPDLEKERIKDDKKTLEYPMRNAGFKEAFRFVNKLMNAGLFDPRLLIYKQEQYEEKLFGAKYFMPSEFTNDLYSKFNTKILNTLGQDKT